MTNSDRIYAITQRFETFRGNNLRTWLVFCYASRNLRAYAFYVSVGELITVG